MTFIKERDREQIKKILEGLSGPVKLVFFKENLNCDTCEAAEQLLTELAGLSSRLELRVYNRLIDEESARQYGIDRSPALVLEGPAGSRMRFFGIPSGYEFVTLLEGLKDAANGAADLSPSVKAKLSKLASPVHIQVFVTPTCPFCPGAVRTAHKFATESPHITADMVEAQEFPELAQKYGVSGVPMVIINDKVGFTGAQPDPVFADAVLTAAGA